MFYPINKKNKVMYTIIIFFFLLALFHVNQGNVRIPTSMFPPPFHPVQSIPLRNSFSHLQVFHHIIPPPDLGPSSFYCPTTGSSTPFFRSTLFLPSLLCNHSWFLFPCYATYIHLNIKVCITLILRSWTLFITMYPII